MNDPSTFDAAVAEAQSGQTLELAPGHYDDRRIVKKRGLTLVAPRGGALFGRLALSSCEDVSVQGIDLVMPFRDGTTTTGTKGIAISACTNVEVVHCRLNGAVARTGVPLSARALDRTGNVIGLGTGVIVHVYDCDGVSIVQNSFAHGWKPIQIVTSRAVYIADNDFHDYRTTPICGSVYERLVVARNHSWNPRAWSYGGAGDHGDAISFWTWADSGRDIRDIHIVDNLHETGGGTEMIGIYMQAHDGPWGFDNLHIERNVIITSNEQGIRVERGFSGSIIDNQVLANLPLPADHKKHPYLVLRDRNGQVVTGNRINAIYRDGNQPSGWIAQMALHNRLGPTLAGEPEAAVRAWKANFRKPKA